MVDDVDGDDTNSCNEPQDGDEVFDDNASDVSHGSKSSRGSISREESESRLQQIKVMLPTTWHHLHLHTALEKTEILSPISIHSIHLLPASISSPIYPTIPPNKSFLKHLIH